MRLYIAGPMSGYPEHNFPAFREAANALRVLGHQVFSPVEMDEADGFDATTAASVEPGSEQWATFLGRDIKVVADVDGVCVLDGWEDSRGATLEVHVARALGKKLYRTATYGTPTRNYKRLIPLKQDDDQVRTFGTGATRDTDEGKPDYEGYLSPAVMRAFGAYMLRHSVQSDGSQRASDNWQKGIPTDAYMKSAWRHFMDWWEQHRASDLDFDADVLEEALCALLFNVQGYLHETLDP